MLVFLIYAFYGAILAGILYFFVYKRLQFKNRKGGGPFFFENDCLVLNTGCPYAIPLEDLERVELHYDPRELEARITYHLWVWAVRKNGRTKKIYYTGSTVATVPADMKTRLEEKGVRVVMAER